MSSKKEIIKLITKENYYKKLNLKLKLTTKAILDLLVKYTNKEYTCYPSQQHIAEQLNIDRVTVNRHIKKLEKMKYITILKNRTSKEQQFDNNIYFLNIFFISTKSSITNIKNILTNSYKSIEKKLFKDLEHKTKEDFKATGFDELKEEDYSFNIETFIDNLEKETKLKKTSILATIVNIQEQIKNNHIFNIRNYIITAFENAMKEQNIKDKVNIISNSIDNDFKEKLLLFA